MTTTRRAGSEVFAWERHLNLHIHKAHKRDPIKLANTRTEVHVTREREREQKSTQESTRNGYKEKHKQ